MKCSYPFCKIIVSVCWQLYIWSSINCSRFPKCSFIYTDIELQSLAQSLLTLLITSRHPNPRLTPTSFARPNCFLRADAAFYTRFYARVAEFCNNTVRKITNEQCRAIVGSSWGVRRRGPRPLAASSSRERATQQLTQQSLVLLIGPRWQQLIRIGNAIGSPSQRIVPLDKSTRGLSVCSFVFS